VIQWSAGKLIICLHFSCVAGCVRGSVARCVAVCVAGCVVVCAVQCILVCLALCVAGLCHMLQSGAVCCSRARARSSS